jgi:hypothetical protein
MKMETEERKQNSWKESGWMKRTQEEEQPLKYS